MNIIETIFKAFIDLITAFRNEYFETADISENQKDTINEFFDYLISRIRGMI